MITPTVGRVVWFYAANEDGGHYGPFAALVCAVKDTPFVNLFVISDEGETYSKRKVRLIQDDDPTPESDYCAWMPYQKAVAAGTLPPTLHAVPKQ
jgi:hypothetical protein